MYVMTNGMMVIPGKFKPADWRLEACVSTRPTKSNGVQSADVPIRGRSSSDDTREQAAKCMASRHGRACFVPSHPWVGVPNILVTPPQFPPRPVHVRQHRQNRTYVRGVTAAREMLISTRHVPRYLWATGLVATYVPCRHVVGK